MNKKSRILRRILSVSLATVLTAGAGTVALPCITNGVTGIVANALESEDGYTYEIKYDTAKITAAPQTTDDTVYIPAEIDGYTVTSIAQGAFARKNDIKKVVIPETITEIGTKAFYCCEALETVEFRAAEYTVGKNAFEGCTNLYSIDLTNATYVGDSAFSGCSDLSDVKYPAKTNTLHTATFRYCTSLESVILPENIDTLDYRVFAGCTGIKYIEIPVMKDFGSFVFEDCNNVRKVVLGDKVEYVPADFMKDCGKLEEVELGNSIDSIGINAFSCCGISSIDIPESVGSIANCAFFGCENLATVAIANGRAKIDPTAFDTTPITADLSKPIYLGDILYRYSGADSTLKVKDGTRYISNQAAGWNQNLKTVELPSTIRYIGEKAFTDCESLESVNLPDSLDSIGASAFSYCISLKSISIPESTTWIASDAFRYCKGLESVNAPDTSIYIGQYAFDGTAWLDSFDTDVYLGKNFLLQKENKARVLMPAGILSIADGAFDGDEALKSIRLSASLEIIGNNAFLGCTNLTAIDLKPRITFVGSMAFFNTGVKSVVLPDKLTETGFQAFAEAEEITLSPKMKTVPEGFLGGSLRLKKVVIPEGVTKIKAGAFSCCPEVEEISFPSTLTEIGDYAFNDSTRLATEIWYDENAYSSNRDEIRASYPLKTVTIPSGVKKIGKESIGFCQYGTLIGFRMYGENNYAKKYALENNIPFNDEYKVFLNHPSSIESYYVGKPTFVFSLSQWYGKNYKVYYRRYGGKSYKLAGTGDGTTLSIKTPGTIEIKIEYSDHKVIKRDNLYTGTALIEQPENTSTLSEDVVLPGTRVTVNGSAVNGSGVYAYSFAYKYSTGKSWNDATQVVDGFMLGDDMYNEAASFSFKPKKTGIYYVRVKALDLVTELVDEKILTLVVTTGEEFKNTSTVSAETLNAGQRLTLNGSAEGGTGIYTYSYYYKRSTSETWKLIGTENTTSATASFKPTSAGSFDVMITAEDCDGTSIDKTFTVEVK